MSGCEVVRKKLLTLNSRLWFSTALTFLVVFNEGHFLHEYLENFEWYRLGEHLVHATGEGFIYKDLLCMSCHCYDDGLMYFMLKQYLSYHLCGLKAILYRHGTVHEDDLVIASRFSILLYIFYH